MADTLSDIYPVPVKYVDGQQPTARFLNAWAAQVDLAFAILARIIGDFDGESSELPTYISNLSRTLGSMGWLDSRLPRGLRYGLDDTEEYPTIVEVISPLSKEAMLMFPPVNGGTLTAGGSISDWTRKNVGSSVALGLHLNDEEQWTNWGRRILATSIIPLAATIEYSVDPDTAADRADDYYDTWGPGTGASVVPNLYEIASSMTEGGLEELCECVEEDAVLWVEMPKIRRISNLSLPFSTGADVLNVEFDNEGATVRWSDDEHAPRYTIPPYIFELAGEDGQIPDGLVSLWVKNGESITRVVNQNSEEQLSFFVDETDRRHVKVVPPEDFSLPHEIDGQEALATQYILAFAGVSVTEAIGHLRGRASSHKHDGTAEDGLVAAASISHRFSPSEYSHSKIAYNHYPQYLLRSGYDTDSDTLNDDSAFMGDLLITRSDKVPGDGGDPNGDFLEKESFSLFFGSTGGPELLFDGTDTDGADSALGKFVIRGFGALYPTRLLNPNLFLGSAASGLQFQWSPTNDVLTLSDAAEEALAPNGIGLRFGALIIADGKISFEDAETADSLVPATLTFRFDSPTPIWTLARGGEVWGPRTRLEVGEVYTDSIINYSDTAIVHHWIGPEGWVGHWYVDGIGWQSGPPVGDYLNGSPDCPWSFIAGSQELDDPLGGGENFLERLDTLGKPPVLKGVNVVSPLKVLRRHLNLDPLISSAIGDPQTSGLILRNVRFIIGIDDDTAIVNSKFKAYLKRFRVFNGGSTVFNPDTMSIVFESIDIPGSSLAEGINTVDLLAANSTHDFDFKEYIYVLEFGSVDTVNETNSKSFNFHGCQLLLSANYIG